jgi:hypothetical protein
MKEWTFTLHPVDYRRERKVVRRGDEIAAGEGGMPHDPLLMTSGRSREVAAAG